MCMIIIIICKNIILSTHARARTIKTCNNAFAVSPQVFSDSARVVGRSCPVRRQQARPETASIISVTSRKRRVAFSLSHTHTHSVFISMGVVDWRVCR